MKMNLRAFKSALKRVERANVHLASIRKALAHSCAHPEEFHSPFHWEHDNGYGRQTRIIGRQCGICWKRDIWNSGTWSPHNA